MKEWLDSRLELAERLAKGECGGSSSEAILILSSLLSGIAADLWPGKGIDRVRFIELWVRYSKIARSNHVSIPLLIDHLEENEVFDLSDRLRQKYEEYFSPRGLPDTRVVTGEEVDLPEDEVRSVVPELSLKDLRQHSYPSAFYTHIRSAYVHEYHVGSHGDAGVLLMGQGNVRYGNWMDRPYRRISFDLGWISQIMNSAILSAERDWQDRPLKALSTWWIDG